MDPHNTSRMKRRQEDELAPDETHRKTQKLSPASPLETDVLKAEELEIQILAEARGITRKNVDYATFRQNLFPSLEMDDYIAKAAIEAMVNIGRSNWKESPFLNSLDALLTAYSADTDGAFKVHALPGTVKGKEVQSKPDFVLHSADSCSGEPHWEHAEVIIEHTETAGDVAQENFSNGCDRRAAYTCALKFEEDELDAAILLNFLLKVTVDDPTVSGRDPACISKNGVIAGVRHAGYDWEEVGKSPLWYRPRLIGRHVRAARVVAPPGTAFAGQDVVMKSTWEVAREYPQHSPTEEERVLRILCDKGVPGLPRPFCLDRARVKNDDGSSRFTRSPPTSGQVALTATDGASMGKIRVKYVCGQTSKGSVRDLSGTPTSEAVKIERDLFNEPLLVRRRLKRILMSYCQPLKEAIRAGLIEEGGTKRGTPGEEEKNAGIHRIRDEKDAMRVIRDTMIVYYLAFKAGFIHGDISVENIVVPVASSTLTGDSKPSDYWGSIVDWNLCFHADGTASNRVLKSGTPMFMALSLLQDEPVPRRTLGHDMESFFAVIVWIASFTTGEAYAVKPLVQGLIRRKSSPIDYFFAKDSLFGRKHTFKTLIIKHFEPRFTENRGFVACVCGLREMLYPASGRVCAEDDMIEQGLFKRCMGLLDGFLGETKGRDAIDG